MDAPKDGGLAFPGKRLEPNPLPEDQEFQRMVEVTYPGLTVRDYFAGKALSGNQAGYCIDGGWPTEGERLAERPRLLAEAAYRVADAMLKAREVQS